MLISCGLILLVAAVVLAEVAHYGRVPNGVNPTLYDAREDPIIQLDEGSFNDTVYCHGPTDDCTAFIVEFYSDWCGHCRTYAPLYKSLAKDIQGWEKVVKVGAMNCADPINEITCRANGVMFFPYIKYFPRNVSDPMNTGKLRPLQSLAEMRDQVTNALLADYASNRFSDWPAFDFLGEINTYGELWAGAPPSASTMAIVFEQSPDSLIGAQLLLDLTKYEDRLIARRCLKTHPLVEALHLNDFPTLAIFRRGERAPVLVAELRRLLFNELEDFLRSEEETRGTNKFGSKSRTPGGCDVDPEKCRSLFYTSELDILKSVRYALFREVARTGSSLSGANLTALYHFLDALSEHYPHATPFNSVNDSNALSNGERAVAVFKHMRDYIWTKGLDSTISVQDYQTEFLQSELENNYPFPITEEWEHCAGSSPQFRGYTCGLWTAFHALTLQAYKDGINDVTFRPQTALLAVRDWIDQFFGCRHCRDHFMRMTTKTFRIDAHVIHPEDGFMYLWKAHNIVNARLKGRDTEDPQFPKYQFPAPFLCPNCSHNGIFDEDEVKHFLINYYSVIKPFQKPVIKH